MRQALVFSLLSAFIFPLAALAVDSSNLELHGYLRAGTGTNGKGGKKECFYNRGAQANEFRLGNECAIYGETALLAKILKKEDDRKPWFNTQVRFAYFPPGNSSFEDSDTDSREINVVEAFVEAGGIDGSPLTYWAGKRFYRDVDLYIFDWYYYGQMNGNGAGVGDIPLGSGKLAAAWLIETGSTRTNVGQNTTQVFDLRWQEVKLGENDKLHFWAAYGMAPGGTNSTTNMQYEARSGYLGATRWRHSIPDGFNDFAVLYGAKLLEGINIYGSPTLERNDTRREAYRWRVVEHLSFQPFTKLGLHFGAAAEYWDPKKTRIDSRGLWWSVGARPVYYLTDHWQLAFEAGHSQIRIRDERDNSGANVPVRKLTRLTIAPQLSLGPSLWARPSLRFYYSQSFWNEANKSYVGVDAPSFAGATSGQSVGVQTEVWF